MRRHLYGIAFVEEVASAIRMLPSFGTVQASKWLKDLAIPATLESQVTHDPMLKVAVVRPSVSGPAGRKRIDHS